MSRTTDGSLNRRRFLQACAATGCGMAASRGVLAALSPASVEVDLEAREAVIDLFGEPARLLTYNGLFPGPLLRVREGQTLRVRLTNRLTEPTNLHFHGLHVSPADNHDNVFLEVPPGESFAYELTVPEGWGGTFWYHPHRHGRLAAQLWQGLAGPLLIDPAAPPEALAGIEEQVVLIKDISVIDGRPEPHHMADWARGKSGRLVLANGQLRPQLHAKAPLVRLRLINACNARMLLLARADGAPLQVIAHDGHLLEAPRPLPEVLLTPAQRLDLLLALEGDEPIELLHKPYNRGAQREPSRPEPLFSLRRQGPATRPVVPARLTAVERLDARDALVRRSFKMAMAFLAPDGQEQLAPIEARLGDLELWQITNVDTQDHVFHLHTWPFQVWRRGGEASTDPGWRDTINLRPGEQVEILIPFRDVAGKSVFHCHIAEHGDAGMMGIIEVGDGGRAATPSFDYGSSICRAG
ncbi:MAG TPA: multicopper oxidase family protein [Geminicoccaceae bacterium]|nr:multicopper oxidase family protein [Geminicoccaceae bacterium]